MKKYILVATIHLLFIIPLVIFTCLNIHNFGIFLYLVFVSLFTISLLYSLYIIINYQRGVFFYVISLLLFLGLPFKLSIHEIFRTNYIEPIGLFSFSSEEYSELLKVSIWGVIGLIGAQLVSFYTIIKKNSYSPDKFEQKENILNRKILFSLILISTAMAVLNLKYNIILFGMTPDVILPFKGNTIFFLILTRFIPYAFFFYCVKNFSYKGVTLGGLLFAIASIGVVSRMVIIIYFTILLMVIFRGAKSVSILESFKRFVFVILLLIIAGYGTVSLSTRLRYVLNRDMSRDTDLISAESREKPKQKNIFDKKTVELEQEANETQSTEKIPKGNVNKKSEKLAELSVAKKINEAIEMTSTKSTLYAIQSLATERWIGVEGLMAVVSYPYKGLNLFINAFKEKGFKNDGKSFFNAIADLKLMKILAKEKNKKNVSTTVPGPFAFFYYPGSMTIVSISIFLFCFLTFLIESFFENLFAQESFCLVYTSVFMAYDFYQFGISPLSFLKYWIFTFTCLLIWIFSQRKAARVRY